METSIAPLGMALRDRDAQVLEDAALEVRRAAAGSLVTLHRGGAVAQGDRTGVLACRQTITSPHQDWVGVHKDRIIEGRSSDCDLHGDTAEHDDTGISVEFRV